MSTPTIQEIDKNVYLGKTATIPRPTADDRGMGGFPDTLSRHQRAWDEAKRWDDENARLRADRHAEVEATRRAEIERRHTEARADLEADLRRRFLATGLATVADWEAAKVGLIAKALAETPDAVELAKAEMARSGQYHI